MKLFLLLTMLIVATAHTAEAICYVNHKPGPCRRLVYLPVDLNSDQYLQLNLEQGFSGTKCSKPHPKTGMVTCCTYEDGYQTECY